MIDIKAERIIQGLRDLWPEAIEERITKLEKEWDIDRILMFNFSVLVFAQLLKVRKGPSGFGFFGPNSISVYAFDPWPVPDVALV